MPIEVWITGALAFALAVIVLVWRKRFVFRRRRSDGTTEVIREDV